MINDFCRRVQELIDEVPARTNSPTITACCLIAAVVLLGLVFMRTPITQSSAIPPTVAVAAEEAPQHQHDPEEASTTDRVVPTLSSTANAPSVAKPSSEVKAPTAHQKEPGPPVVDRLATRIYAEYPELNPASGAFAKLGDWDKVIRLREFSYRHTAFADGPDFAAHRAGANMVQKVVDDEASLAEAYDFFDRARGGVVSGEAAELFQRLCTWAGFEAHCLEVGISSTSRPSEAFTYAVNLVRIQAADPTGRPQSILSIHDPNLNLSYGNSQGQPLDYFKMLDELAHRQSGEIQFIGAVPTPTRRSDPLTVAFAADLEQTRPADFARSWNLSVSPVWSATPDGNWSVRGPRTIWAFEELGDLTWKPELFSAGLPPETIYLHCFPKLIRGTAESAALLQRAQHTLSASTVAATDEMGTTRHN